MQIFNGLGWLIGYLLYGVYFIVKNYGVAVILFTVVLNLLSFPMYINQQKSMAGSAKMQKKMQELQKIYGKDRQKLMAEQQKLYEKEGMGGMGSGCLMMAIPMLVFFSLFYTLQAPVSEMLHLDPAGIAKAAQFIQNVPGDALASTMAGAQASQYRELDLAKNFTYIQPYISGMFSPYDMQKLAMFSSSFRLFNLNLLQSPAVAGASFWSSLFSSPLFLLPFCSIALQILSTVYMLHSQKKMGQVQPGGQQGCMTVSMVIMPLAFGYVTCTIPAAMALYYAVSGVMNLVRVWIMQKYYSPQALTAQVEGSHLLLMEQNEAKMQPLPDDVQAQLEKKIRNWNQQAALAEQSSAKKKKAKAAKKPKSAAAPSKSDYMGQKK